MRGVSDDDDFFLPICKKQVTRMTTIEAKVLDAIRARGTQNFTGTEIASEAGLCRQTVYKIIRKLNARGHRIEAQRRLGCMARLKDASDHTAKPGC